MFTTDGQLRPNSRLLHNQIINDLEITQQSKEIIMLDNKVLPKESFFWWTPKKSLEINDFLLKKFLISHQFGRFQTSDKRTSKTVVFHNDKGILKIHDSDTIKSWILDRLENTDEKEFDSGKFFNKHAIADKDEVLALFQSYGRLSRNVLSDLPKYSEVGHTGTQEVCMFSNTPNSAFCKFNNGIVKVTTDDIEIIPYENVKGMGAIWESSIQSREIKIDKRKGLFETFVEKSMSRKSHDLNDEDWTKNYVLDEEQYLSFRTAYGYLIHTFNPPNKIRNIIFIDCDSDLGRPEGGNGKSLTMESVKYYKNYVSMDGKKFQEGGLGGRFQFSQVTYDTKFIFIDDVKTDFNMETLFGATTGQMEIDIKGKSKFSIPFESKPKIGLTTNYVPAGTGTSDSRRKHIVEFGNYWNHCEKKKESPSDEKHMSKMLFDEFSDDDWNQFYTYGFRCVQEYLQKNLVQSSNQDYLVKSRKLEIEGLEGDGQPTSWMEDWLNNQRIKNNYHIDDGICVNELYKKFAHDNLTYTPECGGDWDFKKFDSAFFKYVDLHPEYEYNKHLFRKGDKKSDRRWLRGTARNQTPHIRITSPND